MSNCVLDMRAERLLCTTLPTTNLICHNIAAVDRECLRLMAAAYNVETLQSFDVTRFNLKGNNEFFSASMF